MRVAIVNDQRLATEALRRVVLSDPAHEIAWTAVDGEEAVRMCSLDRPEVILMDLIMPVMNGAEATRKIMAGSPCPVLVVTATVSGNYALVCEALGHGAYDALCTPSLGDKSPREAGAALLGKLGSVDCIRRHMEAQSEPIAAAIGRAVPAVPKVARPLPLVAIGASTGGPQALQSILAAWPEDFPAGVVVAQHIGADFVNSLVLWLAEKSRLEIRAAASGDSPKAGTVLVAATNDHLLMRQDRTLDYDAEPVGNPYRPSVDVLFRSLADHWRGPSVAVVLTGIGRDGAEGLLRLRNTGWHTIAQDQDSSVVYGMPQAAANLGAAVEILPVDQIATHITNHVARHLHA